MTINDNDYYGGNAGHGDTDDDDGGGATQAAVPVETDMAVRPVFMNIPGDTW